MSKIVRRAKRRAQRAERLAQRAVPGGSDRWLDSRGLWNDPGSGRFVRRGFSSEKARAIDLIDARQVQLREALLAARDAHGDNGFVLVRAVDNRVGNVNRGDTVLVRLDPTNEDRVIIGGEHARYERGSRPRRYAVSIDRFEFVAPEDRPDQMRLPQVNRDVPSATPVPETEVVEPTATGGDGIWGVTDPGALAAWIDLPSAGRDRLDPSVWALVDGGYGFGVRSGGAIWRQGDRVFTWRPGQPVSATRDSGGGFGERVWDIGSDVAQIFPAADGSFLYQSNDGLMVVRAGDNGEFAVAAGDPTNSRLLDARPLPDGTWLTLKRASGSVTSGSVTSGRRSLEVVSVDADGVQSTPVAIDNPASVLMDTHGVAVVGDTAFLPNWYQDRITTVNLVDNTVETESLYEATPVDGQEGLASDWELDDQFNIERGDANTIGVVLDGKPGVLLPIERDDAEARGYWFVSADGTTSLFAKNNDDGSNPLFDRLGGPVVEPTPSESERFVPPEDRNALRGADLSGRDLSGVNLSGYNLSGANLSGAVLRDADLSGANLSRANLTGARLIYARLTDASLRDATLNDAVLTDADLPDADLAYANLTGAILTDADLTGANLINARFRGANLTGANLSRAKLSGANLTGANLTGANLKDVVTNENTRFPDGFVLPDTPAETPERFVPPAHWNALRGANLSGRDLSGVDLSGYNLNDANLSDTNLSGANLSNTGLIRANLSDAYLRDADLTNANLTDADLTDADLTDANLSFADLTGAILTNAILADANLSRAILTRANLTEADLTDARLTGADLRSADLRSADLRSADLTGATLPDGFTPDTTAPEPTLEPERFVPPAETVATPQPVEAPVIPWSDVPAVRVQQARESVYAAATTAFVGPAYQRSALARRLASDLTPSQIIEMADHLNVTENMPSRLGVPSASDAAHAVANWLTFAATGSIDLDAGDGTVAPDFADKSVTAHMETIRATLRNGMFSSPDWERNRVFVDDELYNRIRALAVRDGTNTEKIAALWAVLGDLTNSELTSMTSERADWLVWSERNPADAARAIDALPSDFDLLSPFDAGEERRLLTGAIINALMLSVAPDMPSQIDPLPQPAGLDADTIIAITELADLAAIRRRIDPDGVTDRQVDLSEPGLVNTIFSAEGVLDGTTGARYRMTADDVTVIGDPANPQALVVTVRTDRLDDAGQPVPTGTNLVARYVLSTDGTISLTDRQGIGTRLDERRRDMLVTLATVLERARNTGFVQARTTALTPQDAAAVGFDWTPGTVEHLQLADMLADMVAAWDALYPKDRNPDRGRLDLLENLIGRLRMYGTIPDRITDDEFPTPQEVQQATATILENDNLPDTAQQLARRIQLQTSNYGPSTFTGTMRLVDTPLPELGPDAVVDPPPAVQQATDFSQEAQRAVRRAATEDVSVFLTGQTFNRLIDTEILDGGNLFAVEDIDVRPTNGDMNYANSTKMFTSDDGPITLNATVRSAATGQSRRIKLVANLAQGTLTLDMPGTRDALTPDNVAFQGWEPQLIRALADRAAALGFNRLRSGDDIDALTMAMVGFDWRVGGTTQRQSITARMRDAINADTSLTDQQRTEITEMIQSAAGGLSSNPADWTNVPTPFALATSGWQPGESDWFGRRVFASAAPYQGVIRFDPQDFDPEAAAVSVTGYFNQTMDRVADPAAQYRSFRTTLQNLARFQFHRETLNAAYQQITGEAFNAVTGSGASQTDRDGRTIMEALALAAVQSRTPDFVIGPEELRISPTLRGRRGDSPITGVVFDPANPDRTVVAVRDGFATDDIVNVRYINALDPQTAVLRATFAAGDTPRDVELVVRNSDPTVMVNEVDQLQPQDRLRLTTALRRAGFGEIISGGGDGYELALRGFDWGAPRAEGLPGEYDGRGHLRVADALEARLGDLPEGEVGRASDLIRRLRSVDTMPDMASELPELYPMPTDIARLGWTSFASTWVGREVLADPTLRLWGRQNIQTVQRPEPYSPVLRRPSIDRTGVESTVTNEQVSAAYNFDLGDGYSVRSTVSGNGPSFSISGSIIAPSGATAGSFSRSANFSSGVLSHGSFSMNSSHRGSGVGRRFIAESVANMAALGIDRVVVSAAAGGSYNGSYTWARVGFDWRERYYPQSFGRILASSVNSNTGLSDELRREALAMADTLQYGWTEGEEPPDNFPTPNDLAVLGWEERDGNRWLGRSVISREGWGGVMRLSPTSVGMARPMPPRRAVRREDTRSTNVDLSPQLARQIFDNGSRTSPVGLRVEVSGEPTVRTDPVSGVQSMTVEMMLLDVDGNERGVFQRELRSDGTATLDLSSVFPALRDRGHGYKILADQLEQLERNGFSRVQALAISAVEDGDEEDAFRLTGGYALARAGFDWASPRDARSIADELERVATAFGDTAPDEALEMVERLRSEEWDADGRPSAEFPTPNDVAMLGFAGDRSGSWFGKQLLLGELADPVEDRRSISWGAVARLDPPIGRQSASFDPAVVPTLMTRRGNVDVAAAATAVRNGVRLWDVGSLRVPRSTSEYALAQLQTDLDSAPAPTEERRQGRLGWWYSDYARNNPGLFRRGARIGRRGDRGAGAAFAGVVQREERPLQDRLTRLRRDARGTNREPGFMSQDEAVNAQRAAFMEERLRSVLDNDPVLRQWMLNPPVADSEFVAPRTLLPLFVPTTAAVAQSQLVQPLTSGRENGAEFVGVEFPVAVADIDELDVAEYEGAIRDELYRRLMAYWIQNSREEQDGLPTFQQIMNGLRNAVNRVDGADREWWIDTFGEAVPYLGYGMTFVGASAAPLLGQIISRVENDPTFGDDANDEGTRAFFAEIRRMLTDLADMAPPARTAATLPIDGDRDGFIFDGTKWERPAPLQMPKLDVSSVDVQRRLDEWEPPRPIDGAPHFERERQRTEELDRLMAQPKVDQIVKKPTESWSAEDAAYVAKYGTTKRQQRLALTAQARLAREAGNEELARSLEFQADRLGGSRKKRPEVPDAGSPERVERRMVGSAARKLMGRRKGSQPQDVLSNIRENDRFPELSDRELHEFAVALGRYPDGEVSDARSQMYWELARRAERQGLGDAQRFYVTQARSGWFAEQERKGVDAPDSLFGSGDGNDDWVVAVLPDSVVLAGARGLLGSSDGERARFNRELASRSRSVGNDVLADGFERAAAGLEGGRSIDALEQDGGVSGGDLVERIRVEEGFTLDPRAEEFPTSGFSVAVSGFSAIITREEFEKPGVAEQFIADYLMKMRDDGVDDLFIGGWWDTDNDEIVLDRVEVFDDEQEAIAAGRERNEQAIFDLANKRVIDTGGTGGREEIDIIGADARSVPPEEAVQPDDGRGNQSDSGTAGGPDATADRGTAGRPTTDEVNAAWETWSRNPADEEAARVLADGLFAHDLGDGITTEVDEVSSFGNKTSVYGTIMSDGTMIGNFERVLTTVYVDSDGQPVDEEEIDGDMDVVNVELNVFDRFQGRGIGMRFFAAQVQEAARNFRFDRMTTLAMSTTRKMNGAYVWAKAGYDFDGPATDALRDPDGNPDGGEYFLSLLEDADPDLWQRIMDDPYDITPADLAASPAAAAILKNEDVSWAGVYDLTAVTPEPVEPGPVDGGFPVSEQAVGRLSTEQIEALLATGDVPANVQAWLSAELEGRTAVVAAATPRDGDRDGLIYDGTPRERPAPLRLPSLPKKVVPGNPKASPPLSEPDRLVDDDLSSLKSLLPEPPEGFNTDFLDSVAADFFRRFVDIDPSDRLLANEWYQSLKRELDDPNSTINRDAVRKELRDIERETFEEQAKWLKEFYDDWEHDQQVRPTVNEQDEILSLTTAELKALKQGNVMPPRRFGMDESSPIPAEEWPEMSEYDMVDGGYMDGVSRASEALLGLKMSDTSNRFYTLTSPTTGTNFHTEQVEAAAELLHGLASDWSLRPVPSDLRHDDDNEAVWGRDEGEQWGGYGKMEGSMVRGMTLPADHPILHGGDDTFTTGTSFWIPASDGNDDRAERAVIRGWGTVKESDAGMASVVLVTEGPSRVYQITDTNEIVTAGEFRVLGVEKVRGEPDYYRVSVRQVAMLDPAILYNERFVVDGVAPSAPSDGPGAVVAASSGGGKYTKPELRDRLKAKIMAGSKGGRPGQWSARKAQLLAQEYEAKGGGYRGGKSETQRSLSKWTKEEWTTSDGKPSEGKRRYLPKEAWEKLTPAQKRATNAKKAKGTKAGKQFVGNTEVAKRAARLVREGKKRPKDSR